MLIERPRGTRTRRELAEAKDALGFE